MPRNTDPLDDGPGSGLPATIITKADPLAAVHPAAVQAISIRAMTSARGRLHLGTGDRRPPVLRQGSTDMASQPSRMGNHLRWPDGRITDMAGGPATDQATQQASRLCSTGAQP